MVAEGPGSSESGEEGFHDYSWGESQFALQGRRLIHVLFHVHLVRLEHLPCLHSQSRYFVARHLLHHFLLEVLLLLRCTVPVLDFQVVDLPQSGLT